MKSFRELEVYQMSYSLAIKVHRMTLTLPKYEMYEQGSQVRRSTKSIRDNIAEGLNELISEYEILGRKLNKFIDYVEKSWNEPAT